MRGQPVEFGSLGVGDHFIFDPYLQWPIYRKIANRAYADSDQWDDHRIIGSPTILVYPLELPT